VVAVWLDDETDRLKLTDWIVWSPAFEEEKVQCTVTVCPVHVAAPPPPFRSWAEAVPATKATPSALIPTVNRPVASSGRIRTELTPLSWRGRFRARSAADYATSCIRRIITPARCRPEYVAAALEMRALRIERAGWPRRSNECGIRRR
jgi:hypothetical protein